MTELSISPIARPRARRVPLQSVEATLVTAAALIATEMEWVVNEPGNFDEPSGRVLIKRGVWVVLAVALAAPVLLEGFGQKWSKSEGDRATDVLNSAAASKVSGHEQCRLAREAQYAYAKDGETEEEGIARVRADMTCLAVETCEALPIKVEAC